MTEEICTAWEGWEATRGCDLLAGEVELLPIFVKSLAADAAAAVQKLLERYGSRQSGLGGVRVSEDLHAELTRLTEKNRELRSTLETATAKVQRSKQTYQHYKQDQKLLSQEVKDTYDALLMAKKYYKKHLKFYYTLEPGSDGERVVFVQFFTERRTDNEQFSLRLKRNIKSGRNELIDMTPMLATFKAIKNRLAETNDVPGALTCVRQSFCNIRRKK